MEPQTPLVATGWLDEHLGDRDIRVVEVFAKREGLAPEAGHIPASARFFWKDLCWHDCDREFVTGTVLADRLGAAGIGADASVVIVGDPVQFGTYAFWSMLMAGHERLRIVDGARTKWVAEGRPLTRDAPAFDAVPCRVGRPVASMRLGRDNVLAGLGKPGRALLDVRTPEEYSGERVMEYGQFDHGAERGGRIPGARHLFFRDILNADDTFKEPDAIRAAIVRAGVDPAALDELVIYCRLSHRASLVWFALTYLLGAGNAYIYDGSWTEWGSIVGFPVEK
jgi:thiosulfate/3-mercaptopyruvate sulfurtransferase